MKKLLALLFLLIFLQTPLFADTVLHSNPGDVFKIIIPDDSQITSISATFLKRSIKFFKTGKKWRGLFPSMPEQKAGAYPIVLKVKQNNGARETFHKQVKLTWKEFPTVYFTLKPSRKKLLKSNLIVNEWAEVEKHLIVKRPEQLWKRRFVKPVPGIITMGYGRREYINKKRRGNHRGIDFRASVGTRVKTPNDGIVVFAKRLKAFGGTIVIDHGQGVHTLYFHLSKFLVPVGTKVSKGQYLAKTGNSGISSGPHLHWGLSVHNVRVNPLQWIQKVM